MSTFTPIQRKRVQYDINILALELIVESTKKR